MSPHSNCDRFSSCRHCRKLARRHTWAMRAATTVIVACVLLILLTALLSG